MPILVEGKFKSIRRKRVCKVCGRKFRTWEYDIPPDALVAMRQQLKILLNKGVNE
jgi:transcriptional regulator NrdR family protein